MAGAVVITVDEYRELVEQVKDLEHELEEKERQFREMKQSILVGDLNLYKIENSKYETYEDMRNDFPFYSGLSKYIERGFTEQEIFDFIKLMVMKYGK